MLRRTLSNLGILAVLLGLAGWWVYAGPPAAEEEASSLQSSSKAQASTPTAGLPESDADAAAESTAAATDQSIDSSLAPAASESPAGPVPSATTTQDSATASNGAPSVAATPDRSSPPSAPKRGIADVLEGVDYSIPGERERVVAELKAIEEADKLAAVARAQELGLPLRREMPDGRVQEVAGLDENGQLLYRITHNVNAAISTAANLVQAAPYNLTGTNILVGVWDGGSARSTHQEFSGRVTVRDSSGSIDHATHVAGTIAARGATNNARGMATAARIDSYDWNSDISEMNAAGAATATETNKMLVSNHSYGYRSGWDYVNGGSPFRVWEWYGNLTDTAGYEYDYGRYNTNSRSTDLTALAVPFMTIFWSSGNDRSDNPSNGQAVALLPGSSTVVSYSSSSHPAGDGTYRGGYENIGYNGLAKNIVTIGAVNDAVSGGQRATNNATMSSFSSWGPTDDGRIKPDLVANGVSLYSSGNGGDATYYTSSGTSMSSPNAAGSAVLVAQEYVQLSGQAMRSSTMRGLLIHTADDLGRAGPDYVNGWGLINTKAAVDLVRDHASNPSKVRLTEGLITTNNQTITHSFTWDGVSPIKATLAWTDPAGAVISSTDSRTRNLVNNLDLRLVGPDGVTNRPYVMPFVGNWSQESMSQPATTGINNTDNVEQVYLASPPAPGTYEAVVTYQGSLSGNQQHYSLLISGSAQAVLQAPVITSATTAAATTGQPFSYQIAAESFPSSFGASGLPPGLSLNGATGLISGTPTNAGTFSATITATNGAGTGQATLTITVARGRETVFRENMVSAPTTTAIANHVFENSGTLNYDGTADVRDTTPSSYAGASGLGNVFFTTTTGTFFQISGINTLGYTDLNLSLGHHKSTTQANNQLVVEVSSDGVNYTALSYSRRTGGNTANWLLIKPTGEIPATENLRIRFRQTSTSAQFRVDDVLLTGIPPARPQIVTAASTSSGETEEDGAVTYQVVRGTSTAVLVSATDEGGEGNLIYTWSASGGPVTFSPNANNAAKSAAASFSAAGDYSLTVTVQNASGFTTTSSVPVRVKQTATSISVGPSPVTVLYAGTQQFTALQRDQFGDLMSGQPSFAWSVSGGGSISSGGFFTAGLVGGPHTVTASADSLSATAQVTVTPASATVAVGNLSAVYDGSPKAASVTTSPPGLAVSVTYNGSASAPVNAGSYSVVATVTDPNYSGSASGTLVIARAAQSITFGGLPAKTFGDASFAAGATTSAGLAVSYTSSNPGVAAVSGGTISVVGAGSTAITASQTGDTNYEAAESVEQILAVAKAAATVTLGGLTQAYDGGPKAVTVTTDPPNLTVNVTYDGAFTQPSEVGGYAVVATVNDANYSGSASGTLAIDDTLPTFERWISQFEGLSDVTLEGDPDGDGLRNVEEYFMALDPTLNDAAGAAVQGLGNEEIYLVYRRSKEIHGISGVVVWSTNPDVSGEWSSEEVNDVLLQDHATWELRRASVPWFSDGDHIFLRIDLTVE
ncbi:MAG: MBG domain-containing protein [Chthoniobacterales bacterium]